MQLFVYTLSILIHKLVSNFMSNVLSKSLLIMLLLFFLFSMCGFNLIFSVGRKPKTQQSPISNGSPELGIKKKPREGKGNLGRAVLEVEMIVFFS